MPPAAAKGIVFLNIVPYPQRSLAITQCNVMQNKPTIAVIGGTGDLGSGLARLWAAAGYSVVLGSRTKDKAEAACAATTTARRR